MDDTNPATSTEQLVYIGRARAASGRLAHWYRPIVGNALDSGRQVGTLKRYASSPIGAIVTVHRPAGQPDLIYTAGQYEPLSVNARMGTYTNFVNLLDLAAVAVPAGDAGRSPLRSHRGVARVRRSAVARSRRASLGA